MMIKGLLYNRPKKSYSLLHFHSVQVNITILDINDNVPVWRDEPYNANVVEMSPINTDVISVSAP